MEAKNDHRREEIRDFCFPEDNGSNNCSSRETLTPVKVRADTRWSQGRAGGGGLHRNLGCLYLGDGTGGEKGGQCRSCVCDYFLLMPLDQVSLPEAYASF